MYCENCGTKIAEDVSFCPNCGAKSGSQPAQAPPQGVPPTGTPIGTGTGYRQPATPQGGAYAQPQGYQQPHGYQGEHGFKRKTGWLTFVIVINWITVGFLGLGVLGLLAFSGEFSNEEGVGEIIGIVVVILLIIMGLYAWMTAKLGKFSNGARIACIILSCLGLLSSLASLNIIGLAVQGLTIYALAFDKETVALFTNQVPYQQQQQYGY